MTITEMQDMTEDFLTVKQVATCLRCDPQLIRDQAERDIKFLGFPIAKIGHSIKIPRLGFIDWATTGRNVVVLCNAISGGINTDEDIRDAMHRMIIETLHAQFGAEAIKQIIREYVDDMLKTESEVT